ncbi:hypothetical protein PIROE2DRAFT_58102, partial [Piromyces sp. E2]
GIIFGITKLNKLRTDYSHYSLYFIYYSNIICCIGIPLYNVYNAKYKTTMKISKDEFIKLLFDKNFIILLKEQSIQLFCIENVIFWEMHKTLMMFVFNYYSASFSEKRRNKIIQKKNVAKDSYNYQNSMKFGSVPKGELIGSQRSNFLGSRRTSIVGYETTIKENKENNENNENIENIENIDIVVEKIDYSKKHLSLTKQDIYENAVINFVNENNITFSEDNDENDGDNNTKIEYALAEVIDMMYYNVYMNSIKKMTLQK